MIRNLSCNRIAAVAGGDLDGLTGLQFLLVLSAVRIGTDGHHSYLSANNITRIETQALVLLTQLFWLSALHHTHTSLLTYCG